MSGKPGKIRLVGTRPGIACPKLKHYQQVRLVWLRPAVSKTPSLTKKGVRERIIERRKKIYIPRLQRRYRSNPNYKRLLSLLLKGQSIILVAPEGFDPFLYPSGQEVSIPMLMALQDVTEREEDGQWLPYGHGHILALTLLEDLHLLHEHKNN